MGRKLIQVDARSEGLMRRLGGVCIIDAVSKEAPSVELWSWKLNKMKKENSANNKKVWSKRAFLCKIIAAKVYQVDKFEEVDGIARVEFTGENYFIKKKLELHKNQHQTHSYLK
jgi:hypothetical protein